MKYVLLLTVVASALSYAQPTRGETVFVQTCASGYCHGARGAGAGAPRLAARGFEQNFIRATVTNGITGTSMPSFARSLSRADLTAVVGYVAGLNGVTIPTGSAAGPATPAAAKLTAQAARGQALFIDAVKSFGRCSTCHQVAGFGIPVAAPIHDVPLTVAALRALKTPRVVTAIIGNESMPGLVVAKKASAVTLYDLTMPPPVLRTVSPAEFNSREETAWRHSTVMGAYSDADLTAILAYLRVAAK